MKKILKTALKKLRQSEAIWLLNPAFGKVCVYDCRWLPGCCLRHRGPSPGRRTGARLQQRQREALLELALGNNCGVVMQETG
ncbi:hypothetical protein WKI71_45330 [Streptomyces sp. MS1.AVA.1]|uniref:Transposase n=1 Tax=Streptomyces machairae TaxID=3134109 RepID=A0ABU8UVQ9_9ACTN